MSWQPLTSALNPMVMLNHRVCVWRLSIILNRFCAVLISRFTVIMLQKLCNFENELFDFGKGHLLLLWKVNEHLRNNITNTEIKKCFF